MNKWLQIVVGAASFVAGFILWIVLVATANLGGWPAFMMACVLGLTVFGGAAVAHRMGWRHLWLGTLMGAGFVLLLIGGCFALFAMG